MAEDRTFTAGEAGFITGVNAVTQRDWRRRQILGPADDGWVRHSLRDLARLRLTRALIEAGIPPQGVVGHVTDDFLDMAHSALVGAARPEVYSQQFALIVRQGGEFYRAGIFGLEDLAPMIGNGIAPDFNSCLILNLSALGTEMLSNIETLDRGDRLDRTMKDRT